METLNVETQNVETTPIFKITNKRNRKWTIESCKEKARKFKTRTEWSIKCNTSYQKARKMGWLDECSNHMDQIKKPIGYWTKERCILDGKKYKTRTEWQYNSGSGYITAQKNGWLNECCKHMTIGIKPKGYWDLNNCIKEANKFNHRREWQLKSTTSYVTAQKNGWLDNCCGHMELLKGFWTKDACIKDALKYIKRSEWQHKSGSAYQKARSNGWLDDCCKHMKVIKTMWTKVMCIEDARKYTSRGEWQINSGSAYQKARKLKWLDECCEHMKPKVLKNEKPKNEKAKKTKRVLVVGELQNRC